RPSVHTVMNGSKPCLRWKVIESLSAETSAFTVGVNLITSADVSADKLSITFHLKQGFEPFITVWTDGLQAPMPKHVFASMAPEQVLKSSENLKPSVVSGPFTVSQSTLHVGYTV